MADNEKIISGPPVPIKSIGEKKGVIPVITDRVQLKGMMRDEKGRLLPKGIGIPRAKDSGSLIKKRFGKFLYKILKEELTEEKLRMLIRGGIKIATEDGYEDHKDRALYWKCFYELGLDKDKANDKAQQNINITINAIRENANAAQVFLGIKPISVQVVQQEKAIESAGDTGSGDPSPIRELPAPVSDETPSGQE